MLADPFAREVLPPERTKGHRLKARVRGLFRAPGRDFETERVDALPVGFDGIEGDVHAGITRRSGGREPWYPRGTEMRNERQLSILCPMELAAAARLLDIPELRAEWIGANLVLSGIANLTHLPPRTLLFFEGGATLKVDGDNMPCRIAGARVAQRFEGREDLDLAFATKTRGLRGLVAWVEKPGTITMDETVTVQVPPQWIWSPDG